MKNVLAILKGDMRNLMNNMICAIVAMGLMIVPPMYAWFTTLGFWDPYNNTKGIQVAIANEDEGYSSDILPTKVNAGDQIVSALHANDGFDWIFEDKDKALDGVDSGAYYAAIVIPSDFTAKLMTVFSTDAEPAEIDYYSNEKENAIAPHVTSQGATMLQTQIDESFTKTVANIALSVTSDLTNYLDGEGIANYANQLLKRLGTAIENLQSAEAQTEAFATLIGSTGDLVSATSDVLTTVGNSSDHTTGILEDANAGLADASGALTGMSDVIDKALSQTKSAYSSVSKAIDNVFDSMSEDPTYAKNLISDLMDDVSNLEHIYTDLRDTIASADPNSNIIPTLDSGIRTLQQLWASLSDASSTIGNATSQVEDERAAANKNIKDALNSIESIQGTYEDQLKTQSAELQSQLENVASTAGTLTTQLKQAAANMSNTADSLAGNLSEVQGSLNTTADTLASAASKMMTTRDELQQALDTNDLDTVRKIIGNNPEAIASFLSAPTELNTHAIYEIANNGSSMSAFYTSLSLWIGAIFLIALTSVNLPKKRLAELDHPTPAQLYLGRYGIFLFIALMQALIVSLGNVFVLGIQCEHFWLYILACCVCALVFSNLAYTFTISFGNVGKAICIILLVMQLAGSGGIFPVQMSAPIFQAIYPWLPFAHSMEALSSCIAGIYGSQYWVSLACLLAFLVPSLALGLVARRPMIRVNNFIQKKLDETKFL